MTGITIGLVVFSIIVILALLIYFFIIRKGYKKNILDLYVICPKCLSKAFYKEKEYICENTNCKAHFLKKDVIDISYRSSGIEKVLSNLFYYSFSTVSCTPCFSMEGFIRSLVEKDSNVQREICLYSGLPAYALKDILRDWRIDQTLYWNNVAYKRESLEYDALIAKAYDRLFDRNALFKKNLLSTGDKALAHSIGINNKKESLLTKDDYIMHLYRLRKKGFYQQIISDS